MIPVLQYPFFWTVVGIILGGFLSWLMNRKVLSLQGIAAKELVDTLNRQNDAYKEERNHYRDQLHTERGAHQNDALIIRELESRPDLTSISTLLNDLKSWMKTVSDTLETLPIQFEKMNKAFDERQAAAIQEIRNGNGKH